LPAMGLVAVSGALIAVGGLLPAGTAATVVRWLAFLTALPAAAYGLGMGANLAGGRFRPHPSPGAVDNGTSVAVLLALARQLHRRELPLERTAVTLLLTVGEEAQMQGALAYVRDRERWPMRVYVVNLEVMGQNGGYVLWEEDGTAMLRLPTNPALNQALERAVLATTGERPVRVPTVSSDAFAFLHRGIPATTLGSFDLELGGRGFHSALDNLDRVDLDRLAEAVEILSHFLQGVDSP
jgi:Zn-dependent M28 family amino/carboxypeptidase